MNRRLLLTGTVGSAFLGLGGTGAGALPPSNSGAWALLDHRSGLALVLAWCGIVLLCGAWWGSRRSTVSHLRAACLLWSAPLLVAPPLLSRDLYAYVGQAALVAAGRDPYTEGPAALPGPLSDGVDDVWQDAPAPYGPLWLAAAGLVVRLTGDALVPALLGMRLLAVAGVALLAWALLRLTSGPAGAPERALWLGVANPLVLLHLVGGGHHDALMMGLLTAGVALAAVPPGRPVRGPRPSTPAADVAGTSGQGPRPSVLALAAVLVTLAGLVKAPALAALVFLPLLGTRPGDDARARVTAVLGAAGTVAVTAAVTATSVSLASGLGVGWLGALDVGRARLSLLSPLTGLGTAVGALDAVLLVGLVGAAGLGVVLLAAAAVGRVDPVTALGAALLGGSVLLPVVQPWYLLWGVPLLAARVGTRTAAAVGAACLVLALAIAPDGRHVVRPPLYGLPTAVAAVVALGVLRADGPLRPAGTPGSGHGPP